MKIICTLLLILSSYILTIRAFCIYNDTKDITLAVRQEPFNSGSNYFSRFKREALQPGESACCPYTNTDCSKNANKEDIIFLDIMAIFYGRHQDAETFITNLPSGGWIEIHGQGPYPVEIRVFKHDGTRFEHEYDPNTGGVIL
ncbi:uncharacterized protein BX663DRAFT_582176 [Cokeromyces recurvatus]|uniref:uncharacterized protein n=1 Tax=Cokeromyces recurvatus TaxID=90255 RepID=UPI0022207D44|nr:uncharacterized protein BX663DRAFT_582176 [Cokeromyces recurvatus]KAI7898315.1 hypothetical protein BX663DRAFT_582176 [Cokeromyces recurvatus]